MLKGDLTTTPIETVLTELAAESATGGLHVVDDEGNEALVYFRAGLIYAVSVPGQRPQLGARLISSNALLPEHLAEALEAQRTELQGWRLGELLVHLGFTEQDVVEAFVQEQVRDGITDLLDWTSGRWRFRKTEKTREDVAPPTDVATLLAEVEDRRVSWNEIVESVHGPSAVPLLAARGGEANVTLDPDTWSLLCKIDGERSIADLARECGFTLYEAGSVVRRLVEAGLVDVEEDLAAIGGPPLASVTDAIDDEPVEEVSRLSALTAAFESSNLGWQDADISTHDEGAFAEQVGSFNGEIETSAEPVEEPYPSSLARVSEALSHAPGQSTDPAPFVDPFHLPDELRLRAAPKPEVPVPAPTEDDLRRTRIRQAASAELAAAHAEAEATRHARRSSVAERIANVVDLGARRGAARADAERAEAARLVAAEETERRQAERIAAQNAATRLEAERVAAEAEAARLEAERIAAEEEAERVTAELYAAQAEAERAEAERIAADVEAARLDREQAEAERAAAERIAAEEEAARIEAERAEAERAEAEQAEAGRIAAERVAAEQEAARLEAEAKRIAAEQEAARLESERVEAELEAAQAEAERAAAERIAAAAAPARLEAERIAADEAAAQAEAVAELSRIDAAEASRAENDKADAALEEVARLSAVEQMMAAQVALGSAHDSTMPSESGDSSRMASATAMLAEFSRSGATMLSSDDDADALEESHGNFHNSDPLDNLPRPFVQRDLADTASLLRELSSLGFEDEPPSSTGPRPGPSAPRPITPTPPSKKKRGLFGR